MMSFVNRVSLERLTYRFAPLLSSRKPISHTPAKIAEYDAGRIERQNEIVPSW